MTTPEFQLAFLNKIQRLFANGDFSASYKYALLIAIADIAVESGQDDDRPLKIPHRALGEKFIDLYWQQSNFYKGEFILFQSYAKQAFVISEIIKFRKKYNIPTVNSARGIVNFESLLNSVTKNIVKNPVKYIQWLDGKNDLFLFESNADSITLLPGVAYCLRRFQALIQQLARSHWIDHIKGNKKNNEALGRNGDLESFLFETSRDSLKIVSVGLRKISNKCFYCQGAVSEADVDHFIPHALYPRDLAHNFVLAHPACNRSKSDTLAAKDHLNNWLEFQRSHTDNLSQIGFDAGILVDAGSMNSIARWGYTNAVTGGAQGWVKPRTYEPIDGAYLSLLV